MKDKSRILKECLHALIDPATKLLRAGTLNFKAGKLELTVPCEDVGSFAIEFINIHVEQSSNLAVRLIRRILDRPDMGTKL